jgi:GTPase
MLLDEVELTVSGGHGGPGKVSFVPSKNQKGGPDGGNGGRGGDVYFQTTSDLTALNRYSQQDVWKAENGGNGQNQNKSGKDGEDLVLIVPVGTSLIDERIDEEIELNQLDQKIRVVKGGKGGHGNFDLRSSRRTTPMFAQPGLPGQERKFKVILKLIADFGLIGLPNAGKSSLLNELTAAHAKIGAYAFTTLEPNLGVMDRKVLADIPGLIEGASTGKGLGIKFLKHIEKVQVLLHCISAESEDPMSDFQTVMHEMVAYKPELKDKKQLILLTKTDLVDPKTIKDKIKVLKKTKLPIIPVSIFDFDSLENLKKMLLEN